MSNKTSPFVEERVPCSRSSSNIARRFRVALSKGLRSLYLMVSIRAYRGSRFERIKGLDTGVSRGSHASMRMARMLPCEWLDPLGTRPQSSKGWGSRGQAPEQREREGMGCREREGKLLWTVVPPVPYKNAFINGNL